MKTIAQIVPLLEINLKTVSFFRILPKNYDKNDLAVFLLFLAGVAFNLWLPVVAIHNHSVIFGFNVIPLAFEVCTVLMTCTALSVFVCVYNDGRSMRSMISKLGDFRTAEKPRKLEKLNRLLNRMTAIFIGLWVISYSITVYINLTYNGCLVDIPVRCSMFENMKLPLGASTRKIIIFAHITSLFLTASVGFFVLALGASAWIFVSLHLVHLQGMTKKMATVEKRYRQFLLKKCVKHHYKIIEISEVLGRVYRTPSLVTMLLWQAVMAVVGVKFSVEMNYPCLWLSLAYLAIILIMSSAGDEVVQQSTELSNTVLQALPWDDDVQTRRHMILVMQRTNRAIMVPIGSYSIWGKNLVTYVFRIPYAIMSIRIPN